jgi:hypothetical protein
MECRELIPFALDAKLADSPEPARQELAAHLEGCSACRGELAALEEAWARLGEDEDARLSPEFRRRTLALLEDEMLRARIREFRPRRLPRRLAAAAAVVAAALGGFWASRLSPPTPSPAAKTVAAAPVAGALDKASSLSNVSHRPADPQGRIGVTFDVTSRQTVVEKSRAIEIVSAHYGSGSGEATASPDIVRALTGTLRKDQNPGVRKKAADALAGFKMTPEIRLAFLDALHTDRNPGVRLVAVEALAAAAREAPDAKTIESLREKAFDPAENGFVRAKAASALKGIEF